MWLYIPQESCQSARAQEDSTSASTWRLDAFSQHVTWRGKPTRSRHWSRRWELMPWLRRLFGRTLRPSEAESGVERWIMSLRESPASPTAPQGSILESKTPETSGPTSGESSGRFDPALSLWKMFRASFGIISTPSGQSYEQWASALRKESLRRRKLARRILGSDSSLWVSPSHQPSTSDRGKWKGTYYQREDGTKATSQLQHQVQNWRSPEATDGVMEMRPVANAHLKLRDQAASWPTPTARDHKDRGEAQDEREGAGPALGRRVLNWPTPLVADMRDSSATEKREGSGNLHHMAKAWPTPTTMPDAPQPNSHIKQGYPSLLKAAQSLWPTPLERDHKDGGSALEDWDHPGPPLGRVVLSATIPSPPDPTATSNGHICYPKCLRLNPLFAAWLMGWPLGWESMALVEPAMIDLGWLGTEWFPLQRQWLSRLCGED